MVESIDKLIEHYQKHNTGRFQPQPQRPKNPHKRRGGNHSGRPKKKHLDRAANNFETMRVKLLKDVMPRVEDGAKRDALRGLNSLQRAIDVYKGRYTNTEAAEAALLILPDTPMRSSTRSPARSPSRSSPNRVS